VPKNFVNKLHKRKKNAKWQITNQNKITVRSQWFMSYPKTLDLKSINYQNKKNTKCFFTMHAPQHMLLINHTMCTPYTLLLIITCNLPFCQMYVGHVAMTGTHTSLQNLRIL